MSRPRSPLLDAIETAALDPVRERLREDPSPDGLRALIGWLLTLSETGARKMIDSLLRAVSEDRLDRQQHRCSIKGPLSAVTSLARHHPGDAAVIVALLLNHVVLQPGEALFLPSGTLHCYLEGGCGGGYGLLR